MKIDLSKSKLLLMAIVVCLFASIIVAGCSEQSTTTTPTTPPKTSGPQYGGILKAAEITDGVSTGFPATMYRAFAMEEAMPAIEPLFRFDKAGIAQPYLVSEYKNDVAAKTLTITIKKGIKFHDGTDLNAAAVKWNLEQCMTAKVSGTADFKSVDIIDDYTVRLNLAKWDSTVHSTLAIYPGFMISPTAWQKSAATDKERNAWASLNPVGTGPFMFVSWQKDVKMVFKKFDGYWQKGKPYLDGIEWNLIADSMTRQMALRNNEIDMVGYVDSNDISSLKQAGFIISRCTTGAGNYNLVTDSANPKSPWANLKVRQAAQYAIDCDSINKSVLKGEYICSNQLVDPSHWGYNKSIVGYPYNPTKAKQLLTEAGYPNGFETTITNRVGELENSFQAVQGQLKAIGINASYKAILSPPWDQAVNFGGGWEGLILGTAYTAPDLTQILRDRYGGGGKAFVSMLIPDDYLQAIQDSAAAGDFTNKQKWAQEASKLMVDKYCLQLYTARVTRFAATNPKVHDSGFYNSTIYTDWSPADTWIEKK